MPIWFWMQKKRDLSRWLKGDQYKPPKGIYIFSLHLPNSKEEYINGGRWIGEGTGHDLECFRSAWQTENLEYWRPMNDEEIIAFKKSRHWDWVYKPPITLSREEATAKLAAKQPLQG